MDFHGLLYAAHKNEVSKEKRPAKYYPSSFGPPKKEEKTKGLSVNVQKFLARKEEEERRKKIEEEKKREALFQLRNQDNKAKKRVQVMLKRTKSYNKSVIEDAIDDVNTADTVNGPQQCDEDDYGYVSQEASALYSKMMEKYGSVTPENYKSSKGKKVSGDLLSTKDRVKLALQRQEEEEMGPHKRKRRKKNENEEEKDESNGPDREQRRSYSPEVSQRREKEEKPKPRRPAAPPPLDFNQLLKMAEKKQYEPPPLEVKLKEKRLQQKEPERLMTKKEKLEYERTRDKRMQRDQGSSTDGKKSTGNCRESEGSRTDHDREKVRERERQRPPKDQTSRQDAERQRQQKEQASRHEAERQREEEKRKQLKEHKAREEERVRRQREAEKEQERERVREKERRKEQERDLERRREEDRIRQREQERDQERRRELEERMRREERREKDREAVNKKKIPSIPKKTPDGRGYSRPQSPISKPSSSLLSDRPKEQLKVIRKEDSSNYTAGKGSKCAVEKSKRYEREGKTGDFKKKELISDLFGDRDSESPEKFSPTMKPDKPKPSMHRPVERIKVSGTSSTNPDDLFGDAVTIRTKMKPVPNNNNKINSSVKPSAKAASGKSMQSGSKLSQEDLRKSKSANLDDQKRPIESNGRPVPGKRPLESNGRSVPEKRPKLSDSRPSDGRGSLQNGAGRSTSSISSRPPMKPKEFPPKDLKSRQFPPPDMRSRQFPPPDVRSRQFPPADVARHSAAAKRRLEYERADSEDSSEEDEDEEYDSELDDFIDDGPEESEDYSKYIRDIFGYDKSRYNIEDDDDECMESNFAQVMCEEKRSARIGLMEDLEDIQKENMEKRLKALKKMKGKR